MAKSDNSGNIIGKRLANAYLSSIISISLVLLLVGIASLLLVNARGVSEYFKENMKISVMMKETVGEEQALGYVAELEKKPFIRSTAFISREQGIAEMQDLLGEDFLDVFETAPIPVSVEVTLAADYVSADSLELVKREIEAAPCVDEVVYQRSLVDALNANLSRITLIIAVFIALLMFISFVLINNTVRLNVFARRFTVHTMQLVGATRAFIRRPFLVQAVFQGLFSAMVAVLMLLGILFYLRREFAGMFEVFGMDLLLLVIGIVVAAGVILCVVSTYFVVNKLVSMRKSELYY